MSQMNILVGNIGSGKSMIARRLALREANVINMDSIQAMLSGGRYGMYDSDKKFLYRAIEDYSIEHSIGNGNDIVIDRTNMTRKDRSRFIEIGKNLKCNIKVYDFGAGTTECLDRRIKDSRNVPGHIWKSVFDSMENRYEKPSLDEGINEIIEMPERFKFYAFDFDGTIVTNKFPETGEIIDGTVKKLNKLWEEISNVVIIWTCRSGDFLNLMNKFLLDNKIPFDFINKNPFVDYGSNKIFANEYYDDRNKLLEI